MQDSKSRQRLFFALWPDDDLRDRFDAIAADFRHRGRVTARANWHLTLAFLGSVDAPRRARLEAAASQLRVPPFTLRLDQVDHWRRSQIAWLGGSAPPDLLRLASLLRTAAHAHGLSDDAHAYRAHVTLARDAIAMPEVERINPIDWAPMSFVLVESRNTAEGVRYTPLRAWPLAI